MAYSGMTKLPLSIHLLEKCKSFTIIKHNNQCFEVEGSGFVESPVRLDVEVEGEFVKTPVRWDKEAEVGS